MLLRLTCIQFYSCAGSQLCSLNVNGVRTSLNLPTFLSFIPAQQPLSNDCSIHSTPLTHTHRQPQMQLTRLILLLVQLTRQGTAGGPTRSSCHMDSQSQATTSGSQTLDCTRSSNTRNQVRHISLIRHSSWLSPWLSTWLCVPGSLSPWHSILSLFLAFSR